MAFIYGGAACGISIPSEKRKEKLQFLLLYKMLNFLIHRIHCYNTMKISLQQGDFLTIDVYL